MPVPSPAKTAMPASGSSTLDTATSDKVGATDERLVFYATKEVLGKDIDSNLQQLTDKAMWHNVNADYLDTLKLRYVRPANCLFLTAPRFNPEI